MTKIPNVHSLLREMARRGVQVEVQQEQLKINAPRGGVEELVPDIRRLKPDLLALLNDLGEYNTADTPQTVLLRWRARGAWFWLQEIEALGERWLTLAYDVPQHLWCEQIDAELDRDAPTLRVALDAEYADAGEMHIEEAKRIAE